MTNKRLKFDNALLASLHEERIHVSAAITQLVECLAVNQDVTGSSPVGGVPDKFYFLGP